MRANNARWFSIGVILILAITLVQAQEQPGSMPFPPGGMGGPGGPSLLMSEAVQDDLKLSEKQKTLLKKLQASMAQKTRQTFEEAQANGLEPGEMMEAMGTLNRDHNAAVSKVLVKSQKARLSQIELQREGLLALAKTDIASKLKLSPIQTKKVKSIVGEMRQAMFRGVPGPPGGGLRGGPPPDDQTGAAPKGKRSATKAKKANPRGNAPAGGDMPPGAEGLPGGEFFGGFPGGGPPDFNSEQFKEQMAKMMEAQKKNRDAALEKIAEVLTKEQSAAFEKLTGEPFDFLKLKFGPPGEKPPGADTPKDGGDTPKKDAPAKTQPKMKKGAGGQ